MSYLRRPRLHFSGKAIVRVATANNATQDYMGRPYFDVANVALDTRGDPTAFREWFHQRNAAGYINALWDYYGDNRIRFDSVTTHAAELESGPPITDSRQDSALGSQLSIGGHTYQQRPTGAYLVDTDPTDAFTTQLYSDTLTLQQDGISLFHAAGAKRSYARWLNYWRNLMVDGDEGSSAWWQVAFPKAGITWGDPALVGQSPILNALRAEIEDEKPAQGLVMRFCTYLFRHPSYREIRRRFESGERGAIEGVLLMVGTLGVWDADEFASIPPARLLLPNLASALTLPTDSRSQRKGNTFYLGAALAEVDTDRRIITVDLVNTFPENGNLNSLEVGSSPQTAPQKIDLGTLALGVQEHCLPETCQTVAELPFAAYQRGQYWQTAGIVELPYPPELESLILRGDLVLLGTPDAPLLQETPYMALTDQRSVYLDLEDQDAPTPHTISIQMLLRGKPAAAGLSFPLSQTVNQDRAPETTHAPTDGISPVQDRPGAPPLAPQEAADTRVPHTRFRVFQRARRGTEIVQTPPSVTTGPNGMIALPIRPLVAGTGKLWLNTPDGIPMDQTGASQERYFLMGGLGEYINVRVLPDDRRFDALPDAEITWELMHREVFSYYSLLYPAMNNFIDFENGPLTTAYAALIKALVAQELRETTLYMPVTRELSAGKRRLIQRWADLNQA